LIEVSHRYPGAVALDNVTLDLPRDRIIGLIGPDGVGKSTLLGLVAGARRVQRGRVEALDGDMADPAHRSAVYPRIAYMPQGLGRNLYADLSIVENIDFFGRLFGHGRDERRRRIKLLLDSTGLAPFADRAAGKLSGGMKQKLGLCCALIHDPDLLILDEPTTGVDPLSRRQFWELIDGLRAERPGMTVLVATAYMEEAERFDELVIMRAGKVLATGAPAEIKARTGGATLEDAFVSLLPERQGAPQRPLSQRLPPVPDGEPAIVADHLTRRFGDFTAVDRVSFRIERGEIFGFLGSNGCGKTTTMKMLTGLLQPSEGTARLFGGPVRPDDPDARRRVGYMSQSFSLYDELTVRQNLVLHGRLFQLPPETVARRASDLMARFGLVDYADRLTETLPLGVRQRLSLAVAIIHDPQILILDEPTSGVDPIARDAFWDLLIDLSRNQRVTIFISTHFLNEGARCDRVSFMHAGRVLATGTPEMLIRESGAISLEQAFIHAMEVAAGEDGATALPRREERQPSSDGTLSARPMRTAFSLGRMLTFSRREALELWRDPIRLAFAFFGTAILMLVFGYGISFDVENLRFSALDWDNTPESRAYLETFRGSRYFQEQRPLQGERDRDRALQNGNIALAVEIPPGFGRDLHASRVPEVAIWIDGSMPYRAETIRGYAEGIHLTYMADLARDQLGTVPTVSPAQIAPRFRYNQGFASVFSIVPSTIALMLVFIPAILTALGIVREKELGSIVNLYVTPATRAEFLLGKQLPYVVVGLVNSVVLTVLAIVLFDVPLKGDVFTLALAAALYVLSTTAVGLLMSIFTRSQTAALFGTAIITMIPSVLFSGMMQPVSSLNGTGRIVGELFPTSHFLSTSVGIFTKGLGFADVWPNIAALAAFGPILMAAAAVLLRKQER
jgi:ribosome-dependent ATPase